jgi:lysophospholipase L1-like esterase
MSGPGYQHVAALGSSFAAGPGIHPVVDRAAGRSGANYAHLTASRIGARLTDLTVSGATTDTILEQPQRTLRHRFPPQLDGLPADADLVTVTAAGNDLGYIGGMGRAALAGRLAHRRLTRPLGRRLLRGAVPAVTDEDLERATAGLVRIVEAVRLRAPGVRVVLVDYLTLLGEHVRPSGAAPFGAAELTGLRRVADGLSTAFATAAERTGADLVRASVLSAGHGLGSPEPWVTGFGLGRGAAPFHPNAAGMAAVADALVDLLSGDRLPAD